MALLLVSLATRSRVRASKCQHMVSDEDSSNTLTIRTFPAIFVRQRKKRLSQPKEPTGLVNTMVLLKHRCVTDLHGELCRYMREAFRLAFALSW